MQVVMAKILSMSEKKIVKWGQGYVVFITPEAKKLEWNDKHKVTVSIMEENGKKRIVLER